MFRNLSSANIGSAANKIRIISAFVLLLMFVVGLLVSSDYSMGWDEPHEIRILQKNVRAYADAFLGPDSQVVYVYEELGVNSIASDVERDHGQAAYYPFALYMLQPRFLTGDYDYISVSIPYHYYTFVICFSAVIAFYLLAYELFNDRRVALLCAVTLFIMPRFFAESHYNNKDMVLFSLLMDSFCFGIRAIKHRKIVDALLFALVAALAANTKIIGVFFFGVIGIFYIIYLSLNKLWDKKGLIVMTVTISAFCLLYYAFTPAMWKNPISFFEYCFNNALHFSRWAGTVLFGGQIYRPSEGELPRRYLPQFMLMTTPIFISILATVGGCRAVATIFGKEKHLGSAAFDQLFFILMMMCCALIPLLLSIVTKSLVYNGWRHFYFCFAGVAALMAYGMDILVRKWPKVSIPILLAAILFTSAQNMINHPYQYVYYNLFAGDNIAQTYELDYWGVSTREGLFYTARYSDGDIKLSCWDIGSSWSVKYGFEYLSSEDRSRIELLEPFDCSADYLLENTTYKNLEETPPIPEEFLLEKVISAYGEPILNIYKRS